jgi:hypothetical protein
MPPLPHKMTRTECVPWPAADLCCYTTERRVGGDLGEKIERFGGGGGGWGEDGGRGWLGESREREGRRAEGSVECDECSGVVLVC